MENNNCVITGYSEVEVRESLGWVFSCVEIPKLLQFPCLNLSPDEVEVE